MKSIWKNKNLQLYFAGQVVSLIGTWMQQMAMSWLVYRLTNSPFTLGLIGFTSQAPSLLLTPFAGIIVDRVNRHHLILITQALAMVQAAILTALVWTGQIQLWQLLLLSAILGAITAFDLPTRQTFLVDMLDDKEQLASAIGINSSINTLTRLIGPFFAGLFITWAGEGLCFLVNAISYLAVIFALLFIKAKKPVKKLSTKSPLLQLKEGFSYTISFTPIRDLIFLIALIGLLAMPFSILMPAFAKDVFHGNASTLGFLMGASSLGSVIAAMFLTSRKGIKEISRWIILGCVLFGLGLIGFGLSNYLPLSLVAAAILGFGSMITLAGSNTLIQSIVDEDKRGRIVSIFIMAFLGLSPFGCTAAGALANVIGVGKAVIALGLFTLIIAFIFGSRILQIHLKVSKVSTDQGITEADSEMKVMSA